MMSERPENTPLNTERGNWHEPKDQPSVKPSAKPSEVVKRVLALPKELTTVPQQSGGWHLPQPQSTTFMPTDEVVMRETISDANTIRPEDLIADILGQTRKPTRDEVRPEDFVLPTTAPKPASAVPTLGDLLRPEDHELAVTPEAEAQLQPLPLDDLGGLAELGALDDETDEPVEETSSALEDQDAFSVSEYLALAHLEQEAAKSQEADTVALNADDLSPAAQAALLAGVQQATTMLPKAEPASPTSAEEDAAAYARRMAQQFAQGGQETLDMPAQGAQTSAEEDAAAYARRMAQQFANDNSTINIPQTSAIPAQTPLSPQEEALAEQFRRTAQGVTELRQRYQAGTISQEEVQARQRDYQIYDDRNGDWWMMGIESGVWYRFDRNVNNWVESQPPVPLNRTAVPTATTNFTPDEILSGSLPYLPENQGMVEMSGQPTYGMTGQTPIPNPNQPQYDPNLTMVGEAASLNTLPSSAETLQGMRYTDQQTMPMQAVQNVPFGNANPTMDEAPAYDQDGVPIIFNEMQKRQTNSTTRVVMIVLLALFACGAITLVAGGIGLQVWYNNTVAPYKEAIAGLSNYKPSFQTARILDANGDLIVELNSQTGGARKVVKLEEISPFVLHAVLSTENPTFYDDPGVDILAIGRAFLQNIGAGEIQSGASTITQQLARNLILNDTTVSAERKINEILVAMEISNTYSKNDILQLYMNETFFGNQSYGVEAASEFYFDVPAIELDMAQSALLAGIISSPAQYDPVVNIESSKQAMRVVIERMLETNCILFQHGEFAKTKQPFCINATTYVPFNGEQAQLLIDNGDGTYGGLLALQLASVETAKYLPREAQFKYPHFVNYVQAQIEQQFGTNAMFQRGFTIYTTLNPRIQDEAERTLKQQVAALVNNGVNTGAVMVTDPQTGAIRAMVGSPDFTNEKINGQVDNTRTWQQPGSSIKAVVYTGALEGGPNGYLTPASILWDVPSSYPIAGQQPYQPVNFSGQFYGPTPLRFALQNSYNVSAVKAFEFIGIDKFKDTATRMGLQFLPEAIFGLPTALGANEVRLIDMMKVYGTIANNGKLAPLYSIDRITEDAGGVTLEVPLPEKPAVTQAIAPQIAYLMQNILSDDNARSSQFGANGPLTLASLGIPTQNYVGAKTGTSNDGRDLWTMGFTSNTVVGVWLGTWDNSPTVGVSGSSAPAQVWNKVMSTAITGRAPTQFTNPGGVVQDTVCRDTGTLAGQNCANRSTEIYIQTQPPAPATSGFVQTLNIDSWTGFVANEWCSENVVQKTYANISDPFAVNWIVNNPAGRDWASRVGLPANLEQAPTTQCSQGQILPSVYLNNPANNQTLTGTLTITGQISAPDFTRYDLEYATAQNPTAFQRISTNTQQFPAAGSTIGTWDTASVPNGSYILRLAAYSASGGYVFKTATVNIQNVQPTATPTPQPTPTSNVILPTPIQFGATPIPFDSLNPTPTATLAP